MWPQGFCLFFLWLPHLKKFFFSLLFFWFYSASGNSVPLTLSCFPKSIGISQNRGEGGVVFNADYFAPYQLFISSLVDFNPKGTRSLICFICRHNIVNIQRKKCKGCCRKAQQNRSRLPTVSPWRKVSVLLSLCMYFATRELLSK